MEASLPVDGARLDQCVLGLAAIGAAVHAQRPADRAGDAAEESEPGDRRLLGGTADLHVGDGGPGADAGAVLDLHLAEAAAEPDDDARHPCVAHDQVGAEPDDRDWNLGRQLAQRIGQVGLVVGHEQNLRRPADAEPGQLRERLVGHQPPAHVRQARFQLGEPDRGRS